jgi:hypothetical protein
VRVKESYNQLILILKEGTIYKLKDGIIGLLNVFLGYTSVFLK